MKKAKKTRSIRRSYSKKKTTPKKRSQNRNELTIYLYNVVEDEWSFLSSIQPIEKRYEMMMDCNISSECYLFSNSSQAEFIYISPIEISNSFKNYFQSIASNKKVEIHVPQMRTGLICKDLYTDKE